MSCIICAGAVPKVLDVPNPTNPITANVTNIVNEIMLCAEANKSIPKILSNVNIHTIISVTFVKDPGINVSRTFCNKSNSATAPKKHLEQYKPKVQQ